MWLAEPPSTTRYKIYTVHILKAGKFISFWVIIYKNKELPKQRTAYGYSSKPLLLKAALASPESWLETQYLKPPRPTESRPVKGISRWHIWTLNLKKAWLKDTQNDNFSCLGLWFSKCDAGTSSISISGDLVRNAFSGHSPGLLNQKPIVGPSDLHFSKPSMWFWCGLEFEDHWSRLLSSPWWLIHVLCPWR